MSLIDRIKADRMTAMKAKDTIKKNVLTTLLGEVENKIKTDPKFNIEALIKKFIKDLDFTVTNTFGDVEHLMVEREVLESYLPQQLSEAELTGIVSGYIADGVNNMGQIMGKLKQEYPNQYDGRMASTVVKSLL